MAAGLKKPLTAKAKLKLKAVKLAAKQAAIADGTEVETVPKPKTTAFKKKILGALGGKTVEEASKEIGERSQKVQAELKEVEAAEKAKSEQVDEAKAEYDKAKASIDQAMKDEVASATDYKSTVAKRSEYTTKIEDVRKELYEAQRKVAMMEVLALNHSKMKALEQARKVAQQAAEDAKKNMLEQKQREKEALEATKRALAEMRAEQKGLKRKIDTQPEEADTVPATVPADID